MNLAIGIFHLRWGSPVTVTATLLTITFFTSQVNRSRNSPTNCTHGKIGQKPLTVPCKALLARTRIRGVDLDERHHVLENCLKQVRTPEILVTVSSLPLSQLTKT